MGIEVISNSATSNIVFGALTLLSLVGAAILIANSASIPGGKKSTIVLSTFGIIALLGVGITSLFQVTPKAGALLAEVKSEYNLSSMAALSSMPLRVPADGSTTLVAVTPEGNSEELYASLSHNEGLLTLSTPEHFNLPPSVE